MKSNTNFLFREALVNGHALNAFGDISFQIEMISILLGFHSMEKCPIHFAEHVELIEIVIFEATVCI